MFTSLLVFFSSFVEYILGSSKDSRPIRRSRSISQSFKNLFRSSSKKKNTPARTDALSEFGNGKILFFLFFLLTNSNLKKQLPSRNKLGTHNFIVDHRNYLSTSTPTAKKLSFLQRRKSKQKNKHETNASTNSLSSYDYARYVFMHSNICLVFHFFREEKP